MSTSSTVDENYVKVNEAFALPLPKPPSKRNARSVAASRSAVGRFTGGDKKLIFSSEWHFKIDGVKTVERQFSDGKGQSSAFCYYDEDEYIWFVHCLPREADHMVSLFLDIIDTLIKDETGNVDDDSSVDSDTDEETNHNSKKIVRLSIWKRRNAIAKVDLDESVTESSSLDMIGGFPEMLRYYKFKRMWEFKGIDLSLEEILPDNVILELNNLTGCELRKDTEAMKVFVGAHTEEDCHRAIGKMDNIWKYSKYSDPKQRPVRHLLYTENLGKVRYQIKTFSGVKKSFFDTTLLDNLQLCPGNEYSNLWEATTIRLASWSNYNYGSYIPFKPAKLVAATPLSEAQGGSRAFGPNFTYSSKGHLSQNPMRYFHVQEQCSTRSSSERDQTSGSEITNAVRDLGFELEYQLSQRAPVISANVQNMTQHFINKLDVDNCEQKIEEKSNRCVVLEQNSENKKPVKKPVWDTYDEYGPELKLLSTRFAGCSLPTDRVAKTVIEFQQNTRPAGRSSPSLAPLVSVIEHDNCGSAAFKHNIKEPTRQRHIFPPGKQKNGLKFSPVSANQPVTSVIEVGTLIENFMNPRPGRTLMDSDISTLGVEFAVLEPSRVCTTLSQTLVMDIPLELECLQESNEASTRNFFSTMNQRAPKPIHDKCTNRLPLPSPPRAHKPSVEPDVDPVPDFLMQMNIAFEDMMKGIRGFRGEVLVHAEFGRIILKNVSQKHVADDEKPELFHEEDALANILDPSYRYPSGIYCHPFFSKVLTAIPPDLNVLVDMRNPAGERMWLNQHRWQVVYQFLGHNAGLLGINPFIIEINGESFNVEIKKQRPLGEIYVHGIKRNWDFRVSAVGNEKHDESYTKTYQPLATAINDTLYIPDQMTKPFMLFELPNSMIGGGNFIIDGIRVHRISKYQSVDSRSIMTVSEITELDIDSTSVPGKDITIFKAMPSTVYRPGCEKVDIWHEVTISSTEADTMFKQNKHIELGDEAGWTPESLSKIKAAEAIFLPACTMIKQMDGIGFYNDNGVDHLTRPHAARPRRDTPPVRFQWW